MSRDTKSNGKCDEEQENFHGLKVSLHRLFLVPRRKRENMEWKDWTRVEEVIVLPVWSREIECASR